MRKQVLSRRFDSGYQLSLLVKDTKIAKEVIEKAGVQSELPTLALEYLSDALTRVGPGAGHEECIKRWEEMLGMQLKQYPQPTDRVIPDPGGPGEIIIKEDSS